jgi:hypothetical protein
MRYIPLLTAVGLFALPGCGDTTARLSQTTFNARTAAADAISACDKNSDGKLDENELNAIPAIKSDFPQFDKDNNKSVDANEIAERLEQSLALKVALVPCSFVVKLDGKPLVDADVTLEPENFLASTLQPCIGKTDSTGRVSPSKIASDGDGNDAGLTGVPPGLYKLKITHPKLEKLPQYHSETYLGLHVAPDNPNLMMLQFELNSK